MEERYIVSKEGKRYRLEGEPEGNIVYRVKVYDEDAKEYRFSPFVL